MHIFLEATIQPTTVLILSNLLLSPYSFFFKISYLFFFS